MIRAVSRRYFSAYAGLPREVWLLAVVLFINRSGTMVLPFLTLYLTSQLGLTDASAGQMIGVYGLGSIIGSYLGGRLSERFGPFRVQTVCTFLSVPLLLIIPLWSTWEQIAASLLVLAIVYEAVRPANATAIAQVTDSENFTRSFALQRLAANLGFSFGPAVGGFIASVHFSLLFVVDALTTLLAAVGLLYFFGMRPAENRANADQPPSGNSSPLADGRFLFFLVMMLATHIVFIQFIVTYPLYLRDHFSFSKPQIGLMFAVNTTIIVLFEMVLVDYTRRWSMVRTIGWGSFLCCLGFGMLPFGASGFYCVVAMVVVAVGEMLSMPSSAAYVANRSPRGYEGRYMGWYTVTNSIAWVAGPVLGATIYGINPDSLWIGSLVVGVLVLVGFYALAERPTVEATVST